MKARATELACLGLTGLLILMSGCGTAPANKAVVPPTPQPSPINGSPILKNTNVSFNTYSKEWPVAWEWIDPDPHPPTHHDTDDAVLHVIVPQGRDMAGDIRTAPRYLKAIAGDFRMGTEVLGRPALNYQGAGLLLWRAEKDYIRFERSYGGDGGGAVRIIARKGDEQTLVASIPTDSEATSLRVQRSGEVFVFFCSPSRQAPYQEVGRCETDYPSNILAGLVAVNTASDFDVRFSGIRLEPGSEK